MSDGEEFPPYRDFDWPTLIFLREAGGTATNEEIVRAVVEKMGFDEHHQAILHKDGPQTALEMRIGWARTWLKGMGLIDNPSRGLWTTTEKGRSVVETDLPELAREYQARIARPRKKNRAENPEAEEAEDGEQDESAWQAAMLAELLKMEPDAFERLAQRLLRETGFINTQVTGRSGDGGIDGTGDYRISLLTFPVFFQCKRYQTAVGAKEVRDFRGAMVGRGEKGLLITTSSFTSSARDEATRDGAPPIDLIDGERLCDLLRDHEIGCRVKERIVKDVTVVPEFFASL